MSGERLFEKIDISENPAISNGKSTELSATFLEEKILGWREPSVTIFVCTKSAMNGWLRLTLAAHVFDELPGGYSTGDSV